MFVAVPACALAILVVLSLVAREWKYHMTSVSLMVLTGVLAGWYAVIFWMSG
jgi:hypothetical protein